MTVRPGTDDDLASLLDTATDRSGLGPRAWMAGPLRNADRVLELSPGAGVLGDQVGGQWIDAGVGPGRGRPAVRVDPRDLPVRAGALDGVALSLVLPVLPDLNAVFAELRRVLRPGGTLLVTVPSAAPGSWGEWRLAPLLRPVHRAWPHRSALDRAGWLLAAADFAVLGDDRAGFALPLPDADAVSELTERLPAAGLWPPALPAGVRAQVAAGLARRTGPHRVLPIPLRRLVARR